MFEAAIVYFKNLPYWFPLLFLYLLIGGLTALKPRLVWLPIAFIIPLMLLALQMPLVLSLSHEYQLLTVLTFLAGLAVGGSVLRPHILRVFPKLRFELAGECATLTLVLTIFTLKTAFGISGIVWPADIQMWQCLSALIGTFVPGVFLGRTFFLASIARRTS